MDEISGVEVRLSFPFGSLAERLRESEFPQLTPEASPLSLLFALPILELLGRASVVDDDVGEGDDEEEVGDDTDVVVLNTWVTLSITLPLRILPIVLA